MKVPYVDLAAQFAADRDGILRDVEAVFARGDFVGGKAVGEFEQSIAAYHDAPAAVAVNSGTDALILAMMAYGIGPGDEVITPPNSFVASTAAIVQLGAMPVFADVLADQNIDPDKLEEVITDKTRAIMPVHLTGRMARMDRIMEIAGRHDLIVVEDAAQSIGSRYNDRLSGTLGHAGCFSAHPLKNLNAAGDAGFIIVADAEVAEKLRWYRNHGLTDRDTVVRFGSVSRMDTLQAVVLMRRLKQLPDVIEKRRANAALYRNLLRDTPVFMPPCQNAEFNTFHTFVIQTDKRDELRAHLGEHGVGTAVHYPTPIHLQPAATSLGYRAGDMPVTEQQASRILSLPVHQFVDAEGVEYVASLVCDFLT